MSDRGNSPTSGDNESHWLDHVDTGLIEAHFTEHYGAEDVHDELRRIMQRYNEASATQTVAPHSTNEQRHAAGEADLTDLLDAGTDLTLSATPGSTQIGAGPDRNELEIAGSIISSTSSGFALGNQSSYSSLAMADLSPPPPPTRRSSLRGPSIGSMRQAVAAARDQSMTISLSSRVANSRYGPLGRLNKARLIGELIEVVETLQVEQLFCDYLNKRLIEFRRQNHRDLEPLIYGDAEEAAVCGLTLVRYRFAEAIAYLDRYVREDMELYQIAEDCLKKFKAQRTAVYTRAGESQRKFFDVIDKLLMGETVSDMKSKIRAEVFEFCGLRRHVRKIRKELLVSPFNDANYYKTIGNIKYLIARLCLFLPIHVPSHIRWIMFRNDTVRETADHITSELAAVQVELSRQRSRIMLQQRRERERVYGRIVEIRIVKAPAEPVERQSSTIKKDAAYMYESDSDSDESMGGSDIDVCTMQDTEEDHLVRRQSFIQTIRCMSSLYTKNAIDAGSADSQPTPADAAPILSPASASLYSAIPGLAASQGLLSQSTPSPAGDGNGYEGGDSGATSNVTGQAQQLNAGGDGGPFNISNNGTENARYVLVPLNVGNEPMADSPNRVVSFTEDVLVMHY
ncbi:uncharacterized protein LOC115629365 [Scaptodrosophila lebanonensis]|uniref:Uncharacterized protein LOC115629365 n=1 Tax=Drosophila lebanonensis TaxID=7225 RepID=A0A6J2TYS5_DROLE|nr:uncharacterized protein LOC115629365 [Scaptodrosophila lebanonensis]XP_030381682.1 uncharacterized protein LOC115629365 [Scaptodrosophila lebanonensis]